MRWSIPTLTGSIVLQHYINPQYSSASLLVCFTMKIFLLIALIALSSAGVVKDYQKMLEKYRGEGGLLQGSDSASQKEHFLAFKKFSKEVEQINADDSIPFDAENNQFSIMTESERARYTGMNATVADDTPAESTFVSSGSLPEYVNWVARGAQPAIKDQQTCASCWAFATTSALEASYFLTTGDLTIFSDQELLDCSYEGIQDGCGGGWFNAPHDYMRKNNRIAPMTANSYRNRDGACRYSSKANGLTKATVNGYKKLSKGDASLKAGVTKGVVAVAICLPGSFYAYKSGVYVDTKGECRGKSPVHAVSVVGYGEGNGVLYWRVRNSWGSSWGAGGYIKMSRNANNNIGISDNSYMTVTECSGNDCNPQDFSDAQEEQEQEETGNCKDSKPKRCAKMTVENCTKGNKYYKWATLNCKKTCGLCQEEEDCGECPCGTVKCDDGTCKHEHMCHFYGLRM